MNLSFSPSSILAQGQKDPKARQRVLGLRLCLRLLCFILLTLLGNDSMFPSALCPLSPPSQLQFCLSVVLTWLCFSIFLSFPPPHHIFAYCSGARLSWSAFLGRGDGEGLVSFIPSSCLYSWTPDPASFHCLLLLPCLPLVRPFVTSQGLPLMI